MSEQRLDIRDMSGAWAGAISPDEQFPDLFADVQMAGVFTDSKTAADSIPQFDPQVINSDYELAKSDPAFNESPDGLKKFFRARFKIPGEAGDDYTPDPSWDRLRHMREVWDPLTYHIPENRGSLLALPHPYIKAGGRFREAYLENDGPMAALGLAIHGRHELIENMVDDGAFMLAEAGIIPNANRSYYLDRSQRPFYSMMTDLFADFKGREQTLLRYLPALKQEFAYWTRGKDEVNEHNQASKGMVWLPMPGGRHVKMGRYWSERTTPRPESYREDIETVAKAKLKTPEQKAEKYRHIAAACASARDFNGVHFEDGKNMHTINTTDYVHVDLNYLLIFQSQLLSEALLLNGEHNEAQQVAEFGADIKRGLEHYCLDKDQGWYFNYNFVKGQRHEVWALDGGAYPLYFDTRQDPALIEKMISNMESKFLKKGGLLEALDGTSQNWGGENGWTCDNYIAIRGVERAAHITSNRADKHRRYAFAREASNRVLSMADVVYEGWRCTPEKYNVVAGDRPGGGGEYKVQLVGFPLNNGPLLGIEFGLPYEKESLTRQLRASGAAGN